MSDSLLHFTKKNKKANGAKRKDGKLEPAGESATDDAIDIDDEVNRDWIKRRRSMRD